MKTLYDDVNNPLATLFNALQHLVNNPQVMQAVQGEGRITGTQMLSSYAALSIPPLHIPDDNGKVYKTELVLYQSDQQTFKLVFWHGPDPRQTPHTHPWPFRSYILHGGYDETRTVLNQLSGSITVTEHTYRKGELNVLPLYDHQQHLVAHAVHTVLPGTVTLMCCDVALPGSEWGYVVSGGKETYHYTKAEPDPKFLTRLKEANRYMR